MDTTMLWLAHRGYHARVPENTLAAFAAAVELGVDGIETDVRLSADRMLVLCHDRVSPRGRAVSELTQHELEADLQHAVPRLHEALAAFPGVLWNVEIKTQGGTDDAIAVLKGFQHTHRLLVSSFRHEVVMRCARELDIDCALLIAHRPLDAGAMMAQCARAPRLRSAVWDYNVIDEAVLAECAGAGWRNYIYGAITEAEHAHCARLEVAGIITDRPDLRPRRLS
jgi:glycerophosphoryl diester phosphodiesterase